MSEGRTLGQAGRRRIPDASQSGGEVEDGGAPEGGGCSAKRRARFTELSASTQSAAGTATIPSPDTTTIAVEIRLGSVSAVHSVDGQVRGKLGAKPKSMTD